MSAQHTELGNVRRDYEIREKRGPNKENKSDTSAGDGGQKIRILIFSPGYRGNKGLYVL